MGQRVVVAGEDCYDDVRQIWNGAVDHQPALFALCESVEDVQAAVQIAPRYDFPLSVRGGGHDWAGRALRHGGLVIDLSRMRQVGVDATGQVATVAGGAIASDVSAAATPYRLTAVTGHVGAVGMAGFLLAGGYGPLTTRFGAAHRTRYDVERVDCFLFSPRRTRIRSRLLWWRVQARSA